MATLPKSLLKEFARVTTGQNKNKSKQSTVYGTIVTSNNENYVRFDGASVDTPVSMASGAKNGDRVVVMIKDHKAVVTGNTSAPPSAIDTSSYVKRTDILPISFAEIDEIVDGT
jgi:ribosomal protein L14